MQIGNKYFNLKSSTYIMGILNITPDSFSDGGRYNDLDKALFRVEEMIADGMDILDIGGESTRPGYTLISQEEEITRITPVIEAVRKRFDIPISLDTYKSQVAKAGIQAGAHMINDIWGLKYDENMAKVIAEEQLPYCLMHNRENPAETDFMATIKEDLKESLALAHKAGIKDEQIIIDPGVGFGKTYPQNLEVIHKLGEFLELGYPVLLGTSRKSVIGQTLDLPADQRMEGTLATTVYAVIKGCSFVRVHDVKENARAVKMAQAILNGWK